MAAKMGIPILANRKQHGQEQKSECKLAIAKLAIYVGYNPSAASRQRSVSGGIQDFLSRPDEQTAEKIQASRSGC
jgi:ribosomal protein L34